MLDTKPNKVRQILLPAKTATLLLLVGMTLVHKLIVHLALGDSRVEMVGEGVEE